jgi:hypothetical protein
MGVIWSFIIRTITVSNSLFATDGAECGVRGLNRL